MIAALDEVGALLGQGNAVALTGAGMSTDSGIPDYRGSDSPRRTPMTITEFCSGSQAQQRYWARSHVGYSRMTRASPNVGHLALADLERQGVIRAVITQNVDGLHQAAGSQYVIDLHGQIAEVICLDCAARTPRHALQNRLAELNPGFVERVGSAIETAPDGDAVLADVAGFRIAACTNCGGRLKPDVVFFGENVPKQRVEAAFDLVDAAGVLLVAGSSLTVMSGLRFVRRARLRLDIPVVIVNRGPTRGDEFATVLIDGGCSEVIRELADACANRPGSAADHPHEPARYAHNVPEMGGEFTWSSQRLADRFLESALQLPLERPSGTAHPEDHPGHEGDSDHRGDRLEQFTGLEIGEQTRLGIGQQRAEPDAQGDCDEDTGPHRR